MPFSAIIIGHDTLALSAARTLVEAGHDLRAMVSRVTAAQAWAEGAGIAWFNDLESFNSASQDIDCDYLFSIANLEVLPDSLLQRAHIGAVNFHDGPLPRYAGLNAPVWALWAGETQHAITWHQIAGGVDEGDILLQHPVEIAPGETAFSLNTKCYAAALESFPALLQRLDTGRIDGQAQDLSQRSYFGRDKRPDASGVLNLSFKNSDLLRQVQALNHGEYWNPLCLPKLLLPEDVLHIRQAQAAEGGGAPGTVLSVEGNALIVATGDAALRLETTAPLPAIAAGDQLPILDALQAAGISETLAPLAKHDAFWRAQLENFAPAQIQNEAEGDVSGPLSATLAHDLPPEIAKSRFAALAGAMSDQGADIALWRGGDPFGLIAPFVPVSGRGETLGAHDKSFAEALDKAEAKAPFTSDLPLRMPERPTLSTPDFAIGEGTPTAITLSPDAQRLSADSTRISAAQFALITARLQAIFALPGDTPLAQLAHASEAEAQQIARWNATETDFDRATTIPALIARQAEATPTRDALIFEGQRLSYATLEARANQMAHVLRQMGVARGDLVGLHIRRSPEMLIAAIAIMKAGGAYVPLDPAYPADRVALYIEDSGARVIVSESALAATLPASGAALVEIDRDPRLADAPQTAPEPGLEAGDLAYLIYTSGSTGRPKGVMITHRNVVNFFTGMDARIAHKEGGTWLGLTSLSFDISVLELFWTLSRGFTLVLTGDENRTLVSDGPLNQTGRGMEFSLFYWGNDDGAGRDKYRMLLDGARFADSHGFCAVWTPERHFHAFGGPYPNPSVTGAAVAAVTRNIAVRAGSCVAPLHHPARIAEEWAVIDNLTNGRAALGIASGWQPHDFLLRPENTPPQNKPAMFKTIEQLRALWRGEAVAFEMADGEMHEVVTQPRPVSKELALWVTTAGNPATWREAGEIGANVLTHLLGQSIEEVGEKIKLYHQALRDAGRDPADHKVTLMLHTYLDNSVETAREIAREPMKDYLRSAAGLIKQFAWAFPAFKKPKGVENPMQLDLGGLAEDEMEAILDFAFERYFTESGLFGTVETALARVEALKQIGVDEIACLIDYGIAREQVLEGLKPVAEVLRRANLGDGVREEDHSIAAQLLRHKVSHLQCTPSMARMLVENDEARMALAGVSHMMIGGEALPGSLVRDLKAASSAHIENMYGPTETTIWSTTGPARGQDAIAGIGTPIANTSCHILGEDGVPLAIGQVGELYIGGEGVARGYWQRDDLTAERFVPDPLTPGALAYRTGDLARWRADGRLDFLGRADHQVKLRGHRIELGEIEAALDACPGVTQSVVVAREDRPGDVQLVGYVLASDMFDAGAAKARLAAQLPAHMLPGAIQRLEAFPLTPNKKIDRKALPAPKAVRPAPKASAALQTGVAAQIAAVWAQVLGVEGARPSDHFFDLGGHSLLAVQAHREIKAALDVPGLSITDIFRFPVLGDLAQAVEGLKGGAEGPVPAPVETESQTSSRASAMLRRRQMRQSRQSRR